MSIFSRSKPVPHRHRNRYERGVYIMKAKLFLIVGFFLIILLKGTCVAHAEDISVPILMYHNITEGSEAGDGLNVSEERFKEQMRYLKYYGYNTISFDELYRCFKDETALPSNPVIITFDDGYESNYTYAYPILKKYRCKATVFMITDYIGGAGFLNADMLREMQASRVFDIQSHGVSHLYELPQAKEEKMRYEARKSKEVLEDLLKKPVNIFCYPYGRNSKNLRNILKDEGYIFAVTTRHGAARKNDDHFTLSRIRALGSDTGSTLKKRMESITRKYTSPLIKDVDMEDEHMALFVDAVQKGWIQPVDGKVFPDGEATSEDLIKGLSVILFDVFGIPEGSLSEHTLAETDSPVLKRLSGKTESFTRRELVLLLFDLEQVLRESP